MTTVVTLELSLKSDGIEDAIAIFRDNLADTRAFDGCESIEVIQGQDDPASLMIYEKWQSRKHYEKYLAWRTETGFTDKLGPFATAPPTITYYNEVDI